MGTQPFSNPTLNDLTALIDTVLDSINPSSAVYLSYFCNEEVWSSFRDFHFKNIDPITEAEKTVDEYREQNPTGDLDEILKQRDKDWETSVLPKIKENFGKSQRRLDDFNAKSKPLELLTRALTTLETIDTEAEAFWNDSKVEEAVAKINSLTYELKKIIKHKGVN
jgi:hypothetical protein